MSETIYAQGNITIIYNSDMNLFYLQTEKTQLVFTFEELQELDFIVGVAVESHLRSQCTTCGGSGVIADSLNKESVIDCPECR
jgi:hypothetical protein